MGDLIFDYSKLRGKIREVCRTQDAFGEKIGVGHVALSKRLNNQIEFSSKEIYRSCSVLGITHDEIHSYFFTRKVQKHEQSGKQISLLVK